MNLKQRYKEMNEKIKSDFPDEDLLIINLRSLERCEGMQDILMKLAKYIPKGYEIVVRQKTSLQEPTEECSHRYSITKEESDKQMLNRVCSKCGRAEEVGDKPTVEREDKSEELIIGIEKELKERYNSNYYGDEDGLDDYDNGYRAGIHSALVVIKEHKLRKPQQEKSVKFKEVEVIDFDGDWYVIPKSKVEAFKRIMTEAEEQGPNFDDMEFIEKYSDYATGGAIDQGPKLYIKVGG